MTVTDWPETAMTAEAFKEWWCSNIIDDDGWSLPLPKRWRVTYTFLTLAGATDGDWTKASNSKDFDKSALAVQRRLMKRLVERLDINPNPVARILVDPGKPERRRQEWEERKRRHTEIEARGREKHDQEWEEFLGGISGQALLATTSGTIHRQDSKCSGRYALTALEREPSRQDSFCKFCFPRQPSPYYHPPYFGRFGDGPW